MYIQPSGLSIDPWREVLHALPRLATSAVKSSRERGIIVVGGESEYRAVFLSIVNSKPLPK